MNGNYDWVVYGAILVAVLIVIADKTKLHQKVLSWRVPSRGGAPTPPATGAGLSAWWTDKVHKNSLIVGLGSLVLPVSVVSIMYGGLGWLWVNPKLTWSIALIMIAIAILPAFKPNPGGTARKAIYLSVALLLFWNFPVIGEGLGLGQIFSPGAERVGVYTETANDITVSVTSDPDRPLAVSPTEWSKRIWFNSSYEWTINAEGNRPFWLVCSGDPEQLHDPAKGKFAHVDSGRSCRIKSADGKPLNIYFRRKGLAE